MLPLLLALALGAPEPQPSHYPSRGELAIEAEGYSYARDLQSELFALARAKPGVVRVEEIGASLDGRAIQAFHVTEPGLPIERRVLVFAGIHAMEWISTETAAALLRELIAVPPRGVLVTVVPLLNPDGRVRVEADLNEGENTYRRGNKAFKDLNRDFAHQREARAIWRRILPGYYRTTSEQPLSQPESRAIDALASRGYDRTVSLHAFGGYLYHPWAGAWRRPENHAEYVAMGRRMEAAQGDHAYRTRQLARWGFFFRAHGTELDHMHGAYGAQSWLFELTRTGADWKRPLHSLKTYFRWYNPVDPTPHTARGVAALRELIRAD